MMIRAEKHEIAELIRKLMGTENVTPRTTGTR
jgi:hypothetical protein